MSLLPSFVNPNPLPQLHQDVADYISEWERPDTSVLGLVGDFELEPMMQQLTAAFGDWAPAPGQPATAQIIVPPFDLPPQTGAGKVYLVDRPGSTQVCHWFHIGQVDATCRVVEALILALRL